MIFVKSKSENVLAPGQLLSVFGGFFDDGCSVLFNGEAGSNYDVVDDCITAVCPDKTGSYEVTVKDSSGKTFDLGTLVVTELNNLPQGDRPLRYRMRDFCAYIVGLMPRGNAFPLDFDGREEGEISEERPLKSSVFGKLIWAMAYAVNYGYKYIQSLFDAMDPTRTENLDEWERELGLPIDGIESVNDCARRAEVYRMACEKGGCTKPYFQKILNLMGISADIYEYWQDPSKFSVTTTEYTKDESTGKTSWERVTYTYEFPEGADKNFYWKINVHANELSVKYFTCESPCTDPLVEWRNLAMENLINRIKPAHTVAIFAYDDGIRGGYLLDSNGKRLTAADGRPLTYENHLW